MMRRSANELRACPTRNSSGSFNQLMGGASRRTKNQARYFSSCLPCRDTFHDVIVCTGQRQHSNIWRSHSFRRGRNKRTDGVRSEENISIFAEKKEEKGKKWRTRMGRVEQTDGKTKNKNESFGRPHRPFRAR